MGSLADAAGRRYPEPSKDLSKEELSIALHNLFQGKMNNTGDATLNQNAVSTTVVDSRVGPKSVINLTPKTPSAALALMAWSVQNQTDGSFIITHTSTSTTDCTLFYAVIG